MCGFLIFPKKISKDNLRFFLDAQRHRGVDGYGCLAVDGSVPHDHCKDLNRDKFLDAYSSMPDSGSIIHHRKASIGGVTPNLVHPLPNDECSVLVMQNGTRRALVSVFEGASDTKVIANLWDNVSDDVLHQVLTSTGVVFAADSDGLWFHRDSGRTLYHCKEGIWKGMYASEPLVAGKWALVDEYMLQRLPLDINNWNLECGEPIEYVYQECILYHCKEVFASDGKELRCPSCCVTPKYSSKKYGGHRSQGSAAKLGTTQGSLNRKLPMERLPVVVTNPKLADRTRVIKTSYSGGNKHVTYGDGRVVTTKLPIIRS